MKEFIESDINKLIDAVEAAPLLWDAADVNYKDRSLRDATWTEMWENIFEEEFTPKDLQTKWSNLRIQFRTNHAKATKTKSGQAAKRPIAWKYYQRMLFLQAAEDEQTNQSDSNLVSYL